jgi:hypothetical protein
VQLVKRELAAKEAQVLFLERSEARQGELIEMMQHAFAIVNDLAVPALKAAIDQALKLDLPESYLEKLASVKEAVQKLMRLSQMASSAKFDLGKEKIETDLVSYTGQYLRWQWLDSLKEWGIRLHVEESEIDYHRKLDILAYSIIIDNLVHNSYKAECRNFFVRFTKDDKKLSILFGDDGKGIS